MLKQDGRREPGQKETRERQRFAASLVRLAWLHLERAVWGEHGPRKVMRVHGSSGR